MFEMNCNICRILSKKQTITRLGTGNLGSPFSC